jgi:hypothetical protein
MVSTFYFTSTSSEQPQNTLNVNSLSSGKKVARKFQDAVFHSIVLREEVAGTKRIFNSLNPKSLIIWSAVFFEK